ncbi:MAG TPA: S16 family serine protease [Mycobacteriales bacterium]|nr:S16 family serine protease [Mycobacteriales bacterium]
MARRGRTLGVATALAVGLGVVGAQIPVPYVGLGPGPVFDTLGTVSPGDAGAEAIITITGVRTYPADGRLDLTTVSVFGAGRQQLDLGTALRYWLDRDFAVVPSEILFPEDKSPEEVDAETAKEMEESQQSAVTAALRELNIPAKTTIVVREVGAGTPAEGVLREDDVLTAIDGTAVASAEQLRALLRTRKPGAGVRVTYRRGGATTTAVLRTVSSGDAENRPIIGVDLREEAEYPFTVMLKTDDVGGPSAGLMFALGIIEQLTPGSLTGGVHVAGTGTITDEGVVGPIGGIQQKLIAARRAGARHFLVPAGNFADATATGPDGLKLHKIATLDDALEALQGIKAAG